jgi:putative phosphoesterase
MGSDPKAQDNLRTIRVGLISDTHGLLRSAAERELHGSDYIVHAGDICDPAILESLARIAPVTAVRGNNDRGPWAERLPETAQLNVDGIAILAIHDIATLRIDLRAAGVRVVVAGHSHRPLLETRAGVLFVNPGSAGPRRFRLPISVARLVIRGSKIEAQLRELSVLYP